VFRVLPIHTLEERNEIFIDSGEDNAFIRGAEVMEPGLNIVAFVNFLFKYAFLSLEPLMVELGIMSELSFESFK
jgi:hypothetical protein